MKVEYFIFNIVVVSGPILASFERNLRFVQYWRQASMAVAVTAIPFIIWDIAVTGYHWHFNETFTLPVRFLGLPPGEWLFFLTVPFAGLFVWQVLLYYRPGPPAQKSSAVWLAPLIFVVGSVLLMYGLEYTGLAILALVPVVVLDSVLGTGVLVNRNILPFDAFIVAAIALCNGYLTARPIVLYNEATMSGFRLGTIPVEDFAYGTALMLMATVLFERCKRGGRRG